MQINGKNQETEVTVSRKMPKGWMPLKASKVKLK